MAGSSVTETITRAFRTIKEMIEDRMPQDQDMPQSELEYSQKLSEITNRLKSVSEEDIAALVSSKSTFAIDVDTKLRIIFCLEPKLKLSSKDRKDKEKHLAYVVETKIDEQGERVEVPVFFDKYIVVLKEKGTANNTKNINEQFITAAVPLASVEIFDVKELVFNISKHSLVPKHILIRSSNKQAIDEILSSVSVKTKAQLPAILKTDPMARYIDAKPGDVVKIVRYSPTSGLHTFYRHCI